MPHAGKGLGGWRWRLEGRLLEGQQRDHSAAVALLQEVLETYTDVTRFPRWARQGGGGKSRVVRVGLPGQATSAGQSLDA